MSALLVLCGLPPQASAHAYIVGTEPTIGSVLTGAPQRVLITFDEPVTIDAGAMEVLDPTGTRVDGGIVSQPAHDRIDVQLRGARRHGTYTVSWRVTSADTHVVHGVFSFSVGRPTNVGAVRNRALASGAVPAAVTVGFSVVRGVNLLLLLICGGGALALVFVVGDAGAEVHRRLLVALSGAALVLVLAALGGIALQGAEVSGSNIGGGFAGSALAVVRDQRFGAVWLARAWLAVLYASVAIAAQRASPRVRRVATRVLVALGAALLVTPSLSGHADAAGTLYFTADLVHVLAAAAWVGGLATMLLALALAGRDGRAALVRASAPRLSLLATGAVGTLMVGGVLSAIHEVGAWRGLWQSTYGELVLVKIGLGLPVLALGALNHFVAVPALHAAADGERTRRRLVRAIGAEVALLCAVVGVTGVLGGQPPARNAVALTASTSMTRPVGPYRATITTTPATVGSDRIIIELTRRARRPPEIGEVDGALRGPDGNTTQLNVTQTAPLGFGAAAAAFTAAGAWELELTVRTGAREWLARIPIEIHPAGAL
ncbi:MAG: copper resistance CopC/CopD family protein [Solirubrobacteraceae bacterium]